MISNILTDTEHKMVKSIESLQHELSKLRTGRAHPSILEGVMVDYYGSSTPLKQLASIIVTDARTLTVTPFDKASVAAIDKAIRTSELGLNPATAGTVIRVPLPSLTEETRKQLAKQMRSIVENARVSVRNNRRDANNNIKNLLKDKAITEDDSNKAQDKIQKLTDKFISEIDKLATSKEEDLMQI